MATRDGLLAAAARVFVTRGYHGATIREIVAEAGFTTPALYYHFEGKAQLHLELVRSARERFRKLLEEALAPRDGAVERLRGITAAYLSFGREDSARLRFVCAELFQPREAEVPDLGLEELRRWLELRVEEVLREGIARRELRVDDVAGARRLFMALLSGLLLELARAPEHPVLDERQADQLLGPLLRGIACRKEDA